MKSRKKIGKYLLMIIVILIAMAGGYAFAMREQIMGKNGQTNEPTSPASGNVSSGLRDYSDEQKYTSPNVREDYGLKTISTFEEFDDLKKRMGMKTFFVLGQTGCHFCEMYTPVLKEVAEVYKIEIVYINIKEFSQEDYEKMMASELMIPKSCSLTGEDVPLANGFNTPLSLFVENGKSYNCIRGYKDRANLVKELKRIGYVD